jgi:hypothetical protein
MSLVRNPGRGELAIMLWLVIKGAEPRLAHAVAS